MQQQSVSFHSMFWGFIAGLLGSAVALQLGLAFGPQLFGVALASAMLGAAGAWLTLDVERTKEGIAVAFETVKEVLAKESRPRLVHALCYGAYAFLFFVCSITHLLLFSSLVRDHREIQEAFYGMLPVSLATGGLFVWIGWCEWGEWSELNSKEMRVATVVMALLPLTILAFIGVIVLIVLRVAIAGWKASKSERRKMRGNIKRGIIYIHTEDHCVTMIAVAIGSFAGVIMGNTGGDPLGGGAVGGSVAFVVAKVEEAFLAPRILRWLRA